MKKLTLQDVFYHFTVLYFSTQRQTLPLHKKEIDGSEKFYSKLYFYPDFSIGWNYLKQGFSL